MTSISFPEAIAFCVWLSKRCGQHYCLPTSAQWATAAGRQIVENQIDIAYLQRDARAQGLYNCSNKQLDGITRLPWVLGSPMSMAATTCMDLSGSGVTLWTQREVIGAYPSSAEGDMPWPVVVRGSPQGREFPIYDLLGVEMAPMKNHPKLGFRILLRPTV